MHEHDQIQYLDCVAASGSTTITLARNDDIITLTMSAAETRLLVRGLVALPQVADDPELIAALRSIKGRTNSVAEPACSPGAEYLRRIRSNGLTHSFVLRGEPLTAEILAAFRLDKLVTICLVRDSRNDPPQPLVLRFGPNDFDLRECSLIEEHDAGYIPLGLWPKMLRTPNRQEAWLPKPKGKRGYDRYRKLSLADARRFLSTWRDGDPI